MLSWIHCWINSQVTSDLRCHEADVTSLYQWWLRTMMTTDHKTTMRYTIYRYHENSYNKLHNQSQVFSYKNKIRLNKFYFRSVLVQQRTLAMLKQRLWSVNTLAEGQQGLPRCHDNDMYTQKLVDLILKITGTCTHLYIMTAPEIILCIPPTNERPLQCKVISN